MDREWLAFGRLAGRMLTEVSAWALRMVGSGVCVPLPVREGSIGSDAHGQWGPAWSVRHRLAGLGPFSGMSDRPVKNPIVSFGKPSKENQEPGLLCLEPRTVTTSQLAVGSCH